MGLAYVFQYLFIVFVGLQVYQIPCVSQPYNKKTIEMYISMVKYTNCGAGYRMYMQVTIPFPLLCDIDICGAVVGT